ncbi:hypothetical protein PMAYCL1PPCAC_09076, partial [Pristionchus mayeri]
HILRATRKERLPKCTRFYQTDDGTTFFYYEGCPSRLYASWNGTCIYAQLPGEKIQNVAAHRNVIYFTSSGKVSW